MARQRLLPGNATMTDPFDHYWAILFQEGPGSGYILTKPLNHGTEGATYLVQSLDDGRHYVLKQRENLQYFFPNYDFDTDDKTSEEEVLKLLPDGMAPKLLHRTKYDRPERGDGLIHEFCNGGDLKTAIRAVLDKGMDLPELWAWDVAKELCKAIAYLHSGWTADAGCKEDWNAIRHGDLHSGNIFLRWEKPDQLLPSIVIGDWGFVELEDDVLPFNITAWRGVDIGQVANILQDFMNNRCPGVLEKDCPLELFRRLSTEAMELSNKDPEFPESVYIAERLIPIADEKIRELQIRSYVDLRWTKPSFEDDIVLLYGSSRNEMKRVRANWEKELNNTRELQRPWQWMHTSRLPEHFFGTAVKKAKSRTRSRIWELHLPEVPPGKEKEKTT